MVLLQIENPIGTVLRVRKVYCYRCGAVEARKLWRNRYGDIMDPAGCVLFHQGDGLTYKFIEDDKKRSHKGTSKSGSGEGLWEVPF